MTDIRKAMQDFVHQQYDYYYYYYHYYYCYYYDYYYYYYCYYHFSIERGTSMLCA